jgi:hypothetical protein
MEVFLVSLANQDGENLKTEKMPQYGSYLIFVKTQNLNNPQMVAAHYFEKQLPE